MHLPLGNRPAHADQKDLDLILRPAQHAREPRETETLQTIQPIRLAPPTDFLLPFILGPRIHRLLKDAFLDIHEPRLLVPPFEFVGDAQRPSQRHGGVIEVGHPLEEHPVLTQGAVVAKG